MKKEYSKDKNTELRIRISSDDKKVLFAKASKNGMSLSEYVRTKLMAD